MVSPSARITGYMQNEARDGHAQHGSEPAGV